MFQFTFWLYTTMQELQCSCYQTDKHPSISTLST
jgi:hypothetical protein